MAPVYQSNSRWFDIHFFTDWFEAVFDPHVKEISGRQAVIDDNLFANLSSIYEKAMYHYVSDGKSALPWELLFWGHLSST